MALAAAGGGYRLARQTDDAAIDARRAALRSAVGDYRAVFGNGAEVDPRFVRMIEQGIGLNDLAFATEPPATAREMQPVTNAQGRIIGFFTWQAERPLTQMMDRLLPWVAGGAFILVAIAGLLFWQRRRPRPMVPAHDDEKADAGENDGEQQFIRRELPRALQAQALDVHYQPIVAAAGGRITGVEALLRWNHSERGNISPAVFVPVAERMGLMDELGVFVLRRALQDVTAWPHVYVSVNLSPLQVRNRAIVDVVRGALAESGIAPSRLVLEITEGVLIDNPEEMLRRIEELRALGVRIALDDFGSGYSSLGYLQRFKFDRLKIDRSFVAALGRSSNAAVIIQAIVALGRALGVTVVVEGVETEEQRVLLRLAGCDEMQGFLFARPAAADAVARLIAPSAAA